MNVNRLLERYFSHFLILATLITSAVFAVPVSAVTHTVTNTNDSGTGSLRQAIMNANFGDTINFNAALSGMTIPLLSGPLIIDKNLVIDASSLAAPILISGGFNQTVFKINENVNATLKNLDIRHGSASEGGGIYVKTHATLYLYDSHLFRNRARDGGGGIFIESNALGVLINCLVLQNDAESIQESTGGGIENYGTLSVVHSTFLENYADFGGGAINNNGILSVSESIFVDNDTWAHGGAIRNVGEATVAESTFTGNHSDNWGGALMNWGSLQVNTSTFNENTAYFGGGIHNYDSLTVVNSTLSANQAEKGGGIYNDFMGTVTSSNNTIVHNQAKDTGGGLFNHSSSILNFSNTIIAASMSSNDCHNAGVIATNLNNIVQDGSCDASISGWPRFGPLADNGGPTLTHALMPGSPAIDAGYTITCPAMDQRNVARPYGAACDIGAFEFNPAYPFIGYSNFLPSVYR